MAYRETARTREKKAQRYASILRAALDLTAEEGFSGLTVTKIAERAGVATGSVYRYFPNKATLCSTVFRTASQKELDLVTHILAGPEPAPERLQRAIHAFAERCLAKPVMTYALIAEPTDPQVDTDRVGFKQAYAERFAEVIDQGIAAGAFPEQNAKLSSTALVGTLAEALVRPSSVQQQSDSDKTEQLLTELVALCLRSLGYTP